MPCCSPGEFDSCRTIGNPRCLSSFLFQIKRQIIIAVIITPRNAPMQPTITLILWLFMLIFVVECVVMVVVVGKTARNNILLV